MREKQSKGRGNAEGKGRGNFKQGGQHRLSKETSEQTFASEGVSHTSTGREGQSLQAEQMKEGK